MVAGDGYSSFEESPSCAEQGAWRKPGRQATSPVDSPDWRIGIPVREQQKPTRTRQREPAEKGNPPCSNLRSDRYQVARRGRKSRAAVPREGRPVVRPREMTIVNRTRLTFRPARLSD